MLSNFLSVIIRILEIPLTTSLDSSNFDAKELMLNVPIITLLTLFYPNIPKIWNTIVLVSFIRTDFHYLRDKIDRFIIFFRRLFFIFRLFSFIWLSIYTGVVRIIYTKIDILMAKTIQMFQNVFGQWGLPSFVTWIPSLHEWFLSIFLLHMKVKP